MGKKFNNSKEVCRALKKQGWERKMTSKRTAHINFIHPLYKGKLPVPKEHGKISEKVESSILKAMKEVEENTREGK